RPKKSLTRQTKVAVAVKGAAAKFG
ncbi:hypothetical protein CCACVL1_30547, partial [Corchorus capsularis]